jgi:hypothetical protein
MKRFAACLALIAGVLCTKNAVAQQELRTYLDEADFFRLKDALAKYEHTLQPDIRLYFTAFTDNAFNRNELSIKRIDSFMRVKKSDWYENEIAQLLEAQQDNFSKTSRYKAAAETGRLLLQQYRKALPADELDDIRNTGKIWSALADVAPQQTDAHADIHIQMKRDKASLRNVPVATGSGSDEFIFDTGANISTITRSCADRLGLHRMHTSFDVKGFQGLSVQSDVGIADSLNIGGFVIRNVVFMIMPDEALSFPQIDFHIHGIIGYPVFRAMKEVRISKNDVLTIPAAPAPLPAGMKENLALHGLFPMVQMRTDHDELMNFHFDTGAKTTDLFNNYYELHKRWISRRGEYKIMEFGSAGGTRRMAAYVLDNFSFYIGDTRATLPHVTVMTKPIKNRHELVYGNIGQDLMDLFDEITINFEYMYVLFK